MFALLGSPMVRYALVVALLVASYGLTYMLGRSDGAAGVKIEMASMGADYEAEIKAMEVLHEAALEKWRQTYMATMKATGDVKAELEKELAEAKGKVVEVTKVITKEVVKYVPAEADAACIVPVGFQWVYNSTIDGVSPSLHSARRAHGDVGAPSGIALSGVAETAGRNNLECTYRGEIIEKWQEWYRKNKAITDRL